jgi:hypothetical protein
MEKKVASYTGSLMFMKTPMAFLQWLKEKESFQPIFLIASIFLVVLLRFFLKKSRKGMPINLPPCPPKLPF